MHRKLTHLRQQYKHIVNKQRLAQLLFRLQLQISAILCCYLRTCLRAFGANPPKEVEMTGGN